ncbi:sporulation protein [Streptomyces drozdowiczii]|uniref:Sporulation protein n=1 Tax=Streptomyces drozdowiczii TaxID=202862 RepID=A0ABY6PUT4_9ACTN|nr:sporulation protein [Streptomyces drozdowiczii]MCX0244728.1 sporulation protein [Streptomyces drozdowiczii]UZK55536.1 sporulation protein [Streptomyces drozdowiczii]
MVFKRLRRIGGGGSVPLEVDTQVAAGFVQPGGLLEGEVLLRALDREVEVGGIELKMFAEVTPSYEGGETQETICWPDASAYFTLAKGEERRVPFQHRLPWDVPVTEVSGQAVGAVLGLGTKVRIGEDEAVGDHDLVHVAALPLHEAVFDAFAAEGYLCDACEVTDDRIPTVEYGLYLTQTFQLADRVGTGDRPSRLELSFVTNRVGCEIYLRRAAPAQDDWEDKPPAGSWVAAHHDIGRVDFAAEARTWIDLVTKMPAA